MGTMLPPSAAVTNEDTLDAFSTQRKSGSKCQGKLGWGAWWNSPPPPPPRLMIQQTVGQGIMKADLSYSNQQFIYSANICSVLY